MSVAQQHLAECRRLLDMPPREARFWRESSVPERCYLLSRAEHPRHLIRQDAGREYDDLDAAGKAAVGRAYRRLVAWAERAASRGCVLEVGP